MDTPDRQCRKTMARIKQILNERRIAYEQAHSIAYKEALEKIQPTESSPPGSSVDDVSTPPTRGRKLRQRGQGVSAQSATS